MNGAFYIGAIGLDAQQRALDVVANNIANINTVGFKRSAVRFSELVAPARDAADLPMALRDRGASLDGATMVATPRVWGQGDLRPTGQMFDVAIQGDGFIELMGPAGRRLLWRGGTLRVNEDGYLATADGTVLRAMISVPQGAGALGIAPDGTVSAAIDGAAGQLGQIDLVMARAPDMLVEDGNGYYEAADDGGVVSVRPGEEGGGILVQGSLEGSNTLLADEMTNLLLLQRAFAANAQVVQAGDQLMSIVNGLRRL
ncbi:MAG TPA: flagellar hook-basal body protein [Rhizomicrobium sp.]